MINAEKYRDEILAKVDKTERLAIETNNQNVLRNCIDLECSECLFNEGKGLCYFERMKWLLSEYKEPIKLSKLEYDILKYLSDNTRHMYITRDGNGNIFLYDVEPEKSKSAPWWTGRGMCQMTMFNKLFQFVQWKDEEPKSIKKILNNCEVSDGESE